MQGARSPGSVHNTLQNISCGDFLMTHICRLWLAYSFDNSLRRLLHRPEEMLAPYVKEGMIVIGIGCGMAFFSIGMARLVGEQGLVISVDLQQKMLEVLERRAKKRVLLIGFVFITEKKIISGSSKRLILRPYSG